MECILYLYEPACNFQTRSILIPIDKLNTSRKLEFDQLKNYSEKTSENTYIFKIKWKQDLNNPKITRQINYPILNFCNIMESYANGMDDDCYFGEGDLDWYDYSYINFVEGFNHEENFNNAMKMTKIKDVPIKIIEGFLILNDDSEIDYNLMKFKK